MTTTDKYRRIWDKVERYAVDPTRDSSLGNISEHVGVSIRVLNMISNRMTGRSPYAYIKQQRMLLAHAMLVRANPNDTTVTNIATFCGFDSLGRFAVRYRQYFGETPSTTLRNKLSSFDHPFADQFLRDVLQLSATPRTVAHRDKSITARIDPNADVRADL